MWTVPRPRAQELVNEWDRLADRRRQEICGGSDSSFVETLLPAVRQEVEVVSSRSRSAELLDIGCGTGELTAQLRPLVHALVGIDPSPRSIALARELSPGLTLHETDLANFSASNPGRFDVAVANMVLMNVAELEPFVTDVARVLRPSGVLVATLTHPWTWPRYWAYEQAPWFNYEHEVFVRARWKLSGAEVAAEQISTHVHRPLGRYVQSFVEAGLPINGLRELGKTMHTRDGRAVSHPFPRFLLLRAVRG